MFEKIKKLFFMRLVLCLLVTNSYANSSPLGGRYFVENYFKDVAAEMFIHLDKAASEDVLKSEIEAIVIILKETLQGQVVVGYEGLYEKKKTYSAVGDGFILLDVKKWHKAISSGVDIRSAIISILLEINGIENVDMGATLYSFLPRYGSENIFDTSDGHGPFCLMKDYRFKVNAHLVDGTGEWEKNVDAAKVTALNKCHSKGLENCQFFALKKAGLGRWQRYKYQYRGSSLTFSRVSFFYSKCLNLSRCEDYYSYAPLGQLSPLDIYNFEVETKNCHNQ